MGQELITALYERLSHDDELQGLSNSIINQKQLLEDYARSNEMKNMRHFTDDGLSGLRFDRPGFQTMMELVENGKVGIVCIKDMSRLGRDYLKVGIYMERMRKKGVRLIAVNDGVDSFNGDDDLTPFRNIMNEWYARDISKKIKSSFEAKGKAGKHVASFPPYGYLKSPENNQVWIIDEEASSIVRRIFHMTMEGYGPYQIAKRFHDEKIPMPGYYHAQRGMGLHQNKEFKDPYNWSSASVSHILKRKEYLGHTVNFKTRKHFKDKKSHYVGQEEWLIFENTHEAIIEQEMFDNVQRICSQARRYPDGWGEAHPLTGLLYCADCGGKMYVHRVVNGKRKPDYTCSNYSKIPVRTLCKTQHRIKADNVMELVSEMIRAVIKYANTDYEVFANDIHAKLKGKQLVNISVYKKQSATVQKRIRELEILIAKIYEDNTLGKLSDKRYETLSIQYEKEQEQQEEELKKNIATLNKYEKEKNSAKRFIELVKKYEKFEKITTFMLNEFVEKIVVYERDKKGAHNTEQKVEIYFNFIGQFVPPKETESMLTPEQILQIKKREQQRIRMHNNYLKRKANGSNKAYEDQKREEKREKKNKMKEVERENDKKNGVYYIACDMGEVEIPKGRRQEEINLKTTMYNGKV